MNSILFSLIFFTIIFFLPMSWINNNCFCTNDRYMSKVKNTNIRTLVICPILSLLMYSRWQWIDSTTKIISPSFLAYPFLSVKYLTDYLCVFIIILVFLLRLLSPHTILFIVLIFTLFFCQVLSLLQYHFLSFYKWYETIMHKHKNISWINDKATLR